MPTAPKCQPALVDRPRCGFTVNGHCVASRPSRYTQAKRKLARSLGTDLQLDSPVPGELCSLHDLHTVRKGNIGLRGSIVFDENTVVVRGVEKAAHLGEELDDVRRTA